jgi:3-oxoacyl-[acyl-carrier protein] reductase
MQAADDLVSQINQSGGQAIFIHADISNDIDCRDMVAQTMDTFGRIDTLVCNAALFSGLVGKSFFDIADEEWEAVMRVNLKGPWLCAKAVAKIFIEQQSGKIINITTDRLYKSLPNLAHYDASKGGVETLTRVLATELGPHGICVNALAPGYTVTEAVRKRANFDATYDSLIQNRPLKGVQEPQSLVGALLFLSSGNSDFVTGQTLTVDGGRTMK